MSRAHIISVVLLFSGAIATPIHAGEADNILACITAAKEHAGLDLDEFDVSYTGKILGDSTAKWPSVECGVKFGTVFQLRANGKTYVIDGFSGRDAKIAYTALEKETGEAVSLLESRIAILERRLDSSKQKLMSPEPDIQEVKDYIRTGIAKATGK